MTIVAHRPPWAPVLGPEWTDTPQARMKYDEQTTNWTLYWFDRNSPAHVYDQLDPISRSGDCWPGMTTTRSHPQGLIGPSFPQASLTR